MCDTCGCSQPADDVTIRRPGEDHDHDHGHGDHHHHHHDHPHHDHPHGHHHHHHHDVPGAAGPREIAVAEAVLAGNDRQALLNRGWFAGRGVLALNLVSSPGAGKTTLLERTIADLKGELPLAVIEGDQRTMRDAERIEAAGAPAVQVNTGKGCHLDADMVWRACGKLQPATGSVLMIENVGNLVCPALFDLGEAAKVVIISVTEGDDKPLKYPHMFAAAQLCLVNKLDLLPHVRFDVEACEAAARSVNPRLEILRVSATTGEGLERWYDWVRARRAAAAGA
ncbi:MAG: hydrogenase nickel incorporation protein HypB [bacterium]|nr:hydrogenase nickel incorporation protein HypB [bacterium]